MIVAHYFASDVHLRFDRGDRDRRFHAWLARIRPTDSLVIVGDLCDFWMGSRSSPTALLRSPSLRALAAFRASGGSLAIMPGNHDLWMCDRYQSLLGADILSEPHDMTVMGRKLRLVHGHLLGARRPWKAIMESHAFFRGFGLLPSAIARPLDEILAWRNNRGLLADEERHLKIYRQYAKALAGSADLVVIGHVHRPVDDPHSNPRLVVLGGWHYRSSYLVIDDLGSHFHIENDRAGDSPIAPSTDSDQGEESP